MDSTFGLNGKVIESVQGLENSNVLVALQSDNNIIIGGNFENNGFSVKRFTPEGLRDSTFGINGITFFAYGSNLNALAIQPDDKVVCVGWTFSGSTADFGIGRFTSEGHPDSTFGVGGFVTSSIGPANDNAWCLAFQPDMKIILAGTSYNISTQKDDFAIARYLSNGNVDSTFGLNGKVILSVGDYCYDACRSVFVQLDGKIVLCGSSCPDSSTSVGSSLVRLNPDGSLDSGFGLGGIVATNNGIHTWAAIIQNDSKIVQGGSYHQGGGYLFGMTRYNAEGTLDTTFGDNGISHTGFNSLNYAIITSLSVLDNEKILAGGFAAIDNINGFNRYAFALTCYDNDGQSDTTFGINGKVLTSFDQSSSDYALSGLIQPDNKILLAGDNYFYIYGTNLALIRYLSDLNVGMITCDTPKNSFLIYPNPIHENVYCKYELATADRISIALYNLKGEIIQQFVNDEPRPMGQYNEPLRFNRSIYSGIYILSIKSRSGSYNVKITKN